MAQKASVLSSISELPNVFTSMIQQSTTNETNFVDASLEVDINRYTLVGTVATILGTAYGTDLWNKNERKKQKLFDKRYQRKLDLMMMQNSNTIDMTMITNQLNELEIQINNVRNKIFKLNNHKNEENIRFIAVIGNTQHGKSTVCNRLSGDISKKGNKGPFISKRSATSITQHIQHFEYKTNNIVIIDVPGYNEEKNKQYIENLVDYLYGSGGVDAFILVINGTTARIDSNLQNMLKDYETCFGHQFWDNLIICFSRVEAHFVDEYFEMKRDFINEMKKIFKRNNFKIVSIGRDHDFHAFNRNIMKYIVRSEQLINGYMRQFRDICDNIPKVIIEVIRFFNDRGYYNKLECIQMQSPLPELKKTTETLMKRRNTLNGDRSKIKAKLTSVIEKLDNPEMFPLIFTPNLDK